MSADAGTAARTSGAADDPGPSRLAPEEPMKFLPPLLIACVLIALLPASALRAQGTITGTVIDDSTGVPLLHANVFLEQTTLGCASDSAGRFLISRVPVGAYRLIASLVGYEPAVVALVIADTMSHRVDVRLHGTILQAPTVEVSGVAPVGWLRNLEEFRRLLIGTTPDARSCTIVNPEILNFSVNEDNGDFEVEAGTTPLVIENHALGYRISLAIVKFFRTNQKLYSDIIPRFELLKPRSADEEQQWIVNRLAAYRGSFMHFLRALQAGTLRTEGFELYRGDRTLDGRLMEMEPSYLLSGGPTASTRVLRFDDCLVVRYVNEDEDRAYDEFEGHMARPRGIPSGQVSWLCLTRPEVTIALDGHVVDTFGTIVRGYWAFERAAEMLPRDYQPGLGK